MQQLHNLASVEKSGPAQEQNISINFLIIALRIGPPELVFVCGIDRTGSASTCLLAASLDSAKSGHVFSNVYLDKDITTTNPAINSRCHLSKSTASKRRFADVIFIKKIYETIKSNTRQLRISNHIRSGEVAFEIYTRY